MQWLLLLLSSFHQPNSSVCANICKCMQTFSWWHSSSANQFKHFTAETRCKETDGERKKNEASRAPKRINCVQSVRQARERKNRNKFLKRSTGRDIQSAISRPNPCGRANDVCSLFIKIQWFFFAANAADAVASVEVRSDRLDEVCWINSIFA